MSHSSNTFYQLAVWLLHGGIPNNYWINEWIPFTLKILQWFPIVLTNLKCLLQLLNSIGFGPFFFVAVIHTSFNNYLMSTYLPDTVLGARDTRERYTEPYLPFWSLQTSRKDSNGEVVKKRKDKVLDILGIQQISLTWVVDYGVGKESSGKKWHLS